VFIIIAALQPRLPHAPMSRALTTHARTITV
jgi:hypothetical protein